MVVATSTPPGRSRCASVFRCRAAPLVPSARADVQVATPLASRLPRIGRELEAGGLERAVIDATRDAAQRGDVRGPDTRLVPGILQRAALERDVEAAGVAPLD